MHTNVQCTTSKMTGLRRLRG